MRCVGPLLGQRARALSWSVVQSARTIRAQSLSGTVNQSTYRLSTIAFMTSRDGCNQKVGDSDCLQIRFAFARTRLHATPDQPKLPSHCRVNCSCCSTVTGLTFSSE